MNKKSNSKVSKIKNNLTVLNVDGVYRIVRGNMR